MIEELQRQEHDSNEGAQKQIIVNCNEKISDIDSQAETSNDSDHIVDTHDNILPLKELLIVFSAMAIALFLSFVDQTGITIALPYIADELKAHDSISWAGTASLISNTVFMVLFGRLSDIFSRKYVLIGSMLILAFFDLACGFAQTPYQLYIFRAFCGIGNGGITSLTMVIVSDVVTLQDRGKYQGILGACVGLGNALGPFLASAFIERHSWRGFYYMLCPIIVCASGLVCWLVPYTKPNYSLKQKLLKIDYLGFLFSSIGIIFLLIPISGGGSFYSWSSPFVISMITIGGISLILFLYVEKKVAILPMIPLRLFTKRFSLTCLLSQNFFFGMCYYSSIYYYPYYLQIVRRTSVVKSAVLLLCLVIPQSLTSIIGGQIISRTKRYIYVIWFGFISWALAVCLLNLWGVSTNFGVIIITLIINGWGIGAIFQPTLVAAQAQSYREDRAIVISTRNVLRSFGGSIGLAISSSIISNTYIGILTKSDTQLFSKTELEVLKAMIYSSIDFNNYSMEQVTFLKNAYMKSLRNVFFFWIGTMAYCVITTIPIKDEGLEPVDTRERN